MAYHSSLVPSGQALVRVSCLIVPVHGHDWSKYNTYLSYLRPQVQSAVAGGALSQIPSGCCSGSTNRFVESYQTRSGHNFKNVCTLSSLPFAEAWGTNRCGWG